MLEKLCGYIFLKNNIVKKIESITIKNLSTIPHSHSLKGFTLIEMMIVMVIITVLGSLAIPAYQDYVVKAKVINMMSMAQPIKLAVTESLISGMPPVYEKISDQDMIKEITVVENVITITGNAEKLGIRPKDKTFKLILTPDTRNQSIITWKCSVAPADLKHYAPAECQ